MKRLFIAFFILLAVSVQAEIRYVFYMIGDGMGANQVLAAEMYQAEIAKDAKSKIGRIPTCMSSFPYSGQVATFSHNSGITDSAAAGTCLATGKKTDNGHLGTDPDDKPFMTIAEIFKKNDWGVGIMTSVAIDHATPGAFYAHVHNRDEYYKIGTQLAQSDFDFFGGAGFHQPENKSEWNAPNLYDLCEKAGYTFAHGYNEAQNKMDVKKMILIQETDGIDRTKKCESIPFAIDRKPGDLSLSEITETAIAFLEKRYDRFFMMVEGGKIDYAGHSDDGATNIREVLDFDESIRVAYKFYLAHPDETLIVVTADHETGGMALGNSDYSLNLQILQNQKMSSSAITDEIKKMHDIYGKNLKWEQVKSLLTSSLGLYGPVQVSADEDARLQKAYKNLIKGKDKSIKTLYKSLNELGGTAVSILNRKSKLGWTSYAHTASAVPVFAVGEGAAIFSGWHDNSEIAPLILKSTGLNPEAESVRSLRMSPVKSK